MNWKCQVNENITALKMNMNPVSYIPIGQHIFKLWRSLINFHQLWRIWQWTSWEYTLFRVWQFGWKFWWNKVWGKAMTFRAVLEIVYHLIFPLFIFVHHNIYKLRAFLQSFDGLNRTTLGSNILPEWSLYFTKKYDLIIGITSMFNTQGYQKLLPVVFRIYTVMLLRPK